MAELMFGIDYGKGPGNVARATQADLIVEAHGTCCREGIDLANVWTGPGAYNWSVQNSDNGNLTYDQVVDISINHGLVVFGQIATTPWWAMPGDGTSTTLTASASAGATSITVASTSGFVVGKHVRLQDGPDGGSNVEALQIASVPNATTLTFTTALTRSYSTGSNARCTQVQSPANGDERHKWPPDNQYATAFQNACQEVATHFASRITWWEFWNEPNDAVGWHSGSGGGAEYATWLVRCSTGVKTGNVNAKASVGGMLSYDNAAKVSWLNTVRSGAQSSYDGIALHPYSPNDGWINLTDIQALRQNMNDNGDGTKPILLNEYGSWEVPPWTRQPRQREWMRP